MFAEEITIKARTEGKGVPVRVRRKEIGGRDTPDAFPVIVFSPVFLPSSISSCYLAHDSASDLWPYLVRLPRASLYGCFLHSWRRGAFLASRLFFRVSNSSFPFIVCRDLFSPRVENLQCPMPRRHSKLVELNTSASTISHLGIISGAVNTPYRNSLNFTFAFVAAFSNARVRKEPLVCC